MRENTTMSSPSVQQGGASSLLAANLNLKTRINNVTTKVTSSKNNIRTTLINKGVKASDIPTNPTFAQIIAAIESLNLRVIIFSSNVLNYSLTVTPAASIDSQEKIDDITVIFIKSDTTFSFTAKASGYPDVTGTLTTTSSKNIFVQSINFSEVSSLAGNTNWYRVPMLEKEFSGTISGTSPNAVNRQIVFSRNNDEQNIYIVCWFDANYGTRSILISKYNIVTKVFTQIFSASIAGSGDNIGFGNCAYDPNSDKIASVGSSLISSANTQKFSFYIFSYPYNTYTTKNISISDSYNSNFGYSTLIMNNIFRYYFYTKNDDANICKFNISSLTMTNERMSTSNAYNTILEGYFNIFQAMNATNRNLAFFNKKDGKVYKLKRYTSSQPNYTYINTVDLSTYAETLYYKFTDIYYNEYEYAYSVPWGSLPLVIDNKIRVIVNYKFDEATPQTFSNPFVFDLSKKTFIKIENYGIRKSLGGIFDLPLYSPIILGNYLYEIGLEGANKIKAYSTYIN